MMTEIERARDALRILKQWNLLSDARDAYLLAVTNWGLLDEDEKPKTEDYRLAKILECYSCPDGACELTQHSNGLIAWCEAGHVYKIEAVDSRYNLE